MATKDTVVDQIKAQVADARTRLAMLVGSGLEGGWGPTFNPGDNDTSFGPFQMHWGGALGPTPTTAADAARSRANAEDPAWAVAHMRTAYAAAAAKIPDSVWSSDPELAAVSAAQLAERPAQPYASTDGQAAVDQAYKRAKAAVSGGGIIGDLNSITRNPIGAVTGAIGDVQGAAGGAAGKVVGGVAGDVASGIGGALSPIWSDAKNFFIRLGFVGLGLGLVAAGAYETTKPITSKLTSAAEKAAPVAAAAAA